VLRLLISSTIVESDKMPAGKGAAGIRFLRGGRAQFPRNTGALTVEA
jgi:hypothetical protein